MSYCLDTNTIIYYLKGRFTGIRDRLHSIPPGEVAVPEIVVAELFFGVEQSRERVVNEKRVKQFLKPLRRLPFDALASPHYAEIRSELSKKGKVIGPNDLLIAATARAHGLTLVSHNTREFSRIPGLPLEDWV